MANDLINVYDARNRAKKKLPKVLFDYIDGAADNEITARLNEEAFRHIYFNPKPVQGRFEPNLSTRILGAEVDLPVILAPCGLIRLMHKNAASCVLKAAKKEGTFAILSSVSGISLNEAISRSKIVPWYQLYVPGSRSELEDQLKDLNECEVEVLVITVDTPALGNRERDRAHGVAPPIRANPKLAAKLAIQGMSRPYWALNIAADLMSLKRPKKVSGQDKTSMLKVSASPFSWEDLKHIRDRWKGRNS
jgi:isopentenyl diphosphate isomerase/L-lactate dehydrogenase-like FMN-dependent dehydrogenase